MATTSRENTADAGNQAMKALIDRAVRSGGFAIGPVDAQDQPSWATGLIEQFNEAGPKRCCPHLASGDLVSLWISLAPDLLACLDCEGELIKKIEGRLGHGLEDEPGRCSACGEVGLVRGATIAVGPYLLRGLICAACESTSPPRPETDSEDNLSDQDFAVPKGLAVLDLPPIRIDRRALGATTDRQDFDEKGWEMLARSGKLAERLIASTEEKQEEGLDLDQAVIGGLLIRSAKLTRAIFDSTQAEESEAHATLSRSLAETTATLRWLIQKGDPTSFRRFRADSLARWRGFLGEMDGESEKESQSAQALREKVESYVKAELDSAGLTWDDVPLKPNSWGPSARQQFEDLGQGSVYNVLFATHSSYVHPTWHEIRSFHLAPAPNGFHLDPSYAGMVPVAAFVLARLVAEACTAAATVLPNNLDSDALAEVVEHTVHASHILSVEFGDFIARGCLDDQFERQLAIPEG
jgi:hypothetical protein